MKCRRCGRMSMGEVCETCDVSRQESAAARRSATSYTVVVSKDPDGDGYVASVPALGTCGCWAATKEDALDLVLDAVESFLSSYEKHGEELPEEVESRMVNL